MSGVLTGSRSAELFERAQRVIPGGVNSPVRAMRSVGREYPVFVERGSAAQVWDADGNRYVDWVQSWGALPFGHADQTILAAARAALEAGSTFGAPTQLEVELAEAVVGAVPSIAKVRFVSSGTEATMSALRVARAATGRNRVVAFRGGYHGHADPFLAAGGSGIATLSLPSSPGVPQAVVADTLLATYNDIDDVERVVAQAGADTVAAIIVEPIAANMGVVHPEPGFLAALRGLCDTIGAVLIFDEVITGFRVAYGGAQALFDVTPDLTTLGKIIGGGMPCGAFGGRAELMDLVAPAGDVYQAGTLSGNPVAMAAGLATLRSLRDGAAYGQLNTLGEYLETSLDTALTASPARFAIARAGSLLTLFHLTQTASRRNADGGRATPPSHYDADALDLAAFSTTHAAALRGGNLLPASQFEALFVSTAHTTAEIDQLVDSIAAEWQRA